MKSKPKEKQREIKIEGVDYTLAQANAIRDELLSRPSCVVVLTCADDGGVCTQNSPCKCCEYRRHDRKGQHGKHVPAMTPASFVERLSAWENRTETRRMSR